MFSIQARWNAAQAKLPISLLILKNRRYAALQDFAPQVGFVPGAQVPGSELPDLDFVALAAGQGVPGHRVADAAQPREALRLVLGSAGPMLLEIEIA